MYTLDTNSIIYYLKGDFPAVQLLDSILSQNSPLYISTITEIELFGFPNITPFEEQRIEQFLNLMAIIPLDSRIARIAGKIRSRYKIKTLDAAIAATALITATPLITRNTQDFKKIPNLSVLKI